MNSTNLRPTVFLEGPRLNAAALSKIEGLEASTVMEPTDMPGGTSIAMFTDPEGHLVGLIKADS